MKTWMIVVGAVVIAALMFGAGYLVATKVGGSSSSGTAAARGGPDGAFAQLTEEERQQLQTMTEEERQAFFKEKGIEMPAGGPNGAGVPGVTGTDGTGMMRGGPGGTQLLEGTVTAVDSEKITLKLASGGSATVYVDESTVKASVSGASPTVAKDATVYVVAQQEAEGVTAAKLVVVK